MSLRQRMAQSLMVRLAVFVLGGLLMVWVALTAGLYLQMEHEIGELQSRQLKEAGQLLLNHLGDEASLPAHASSSLDSNASMAFSLYDLRGHLIASSHRPALPILESGNDQEQTLMINGEHWRARRFANAHRQLVIAMPASLRRELALEIASDQLLPAGLVLISWLLVTLWGLRIGMRPLLAFVRELQTRHAGNLAPILTPLPDELTPIVARINTLFGQIDQTLERERRFTGDAAHELRTPLAGLQLQLELALNAKQTGTRERALLNVQTSAERMRHLVDQLLKLARLDHAEQLQLAPVDLPRLCKSVMAQCHISGSVKVDEPAIWLADRETLSLLLRNLLDNAAKYAGHDKPVDVVISGEKLTICDHGPGVDTAWLARLGERFSRPDTGQQEGVGLGLSIAQRIATLHGDRLRFQLAEGGGLCVSFRLPTAS